MDRIALTFLIVVIISLCFNFYYVGQLQEKKINYDKLWRTYDQLYERGEEAGKELAKREIETFIVNQLRNTGELEFGGLILKPQ